ncbi:MAG: DUF1365 domain-containing protein [Steroidobacteraceae bacterium]|nr:DUF1365 domain-containing protein [Steroidobacteraceae bacterium]
MHSALYTGWIQHRRFGPARNSFRYRIFMSYIDLAELSGLFDRRWFWSVRRPNLAWFRRTDFLGPANVPLDVAVRDLVEQRTGLRPAGPIRLLTHLRFFGFSFNPVSFYYVFDERDTRVETIVAEITNTPWKERHTYVLPVAHAERRGKQAWCYRFDKQFHVSPFMPMDMRYEWSFGTPGEGLHVHMENYRSESGRDADAVFDATLNLTRAPMTAGALARALLRFPLIPLQVVTLIHWQALKLLWKRVPFHTHPSKIEPTHEHPVATARR